MHLEACQLQLVNVPVQRGGSVRAGEDVARHEKAPSEVLEIRSLPEAGHLHEEEAIILQHLPHRPEVDLEVLQANVLGHLHRDDLVELHLLGDLPIVHAENINLVAEACLLRRVTAVLRPLDREGHADGLGFVVLCRVAQQRAPTAADVQDAFVLLQHELVAKEGHLVVLGSLQGLLQTLEDGASVDHAWAHEGLEEVVAAVIMLRNLLLRGLFVLHGTVLAVGEKLHDEESRSGPSKLVVHKLVPMLEKHLQQVHAEGQFASHVKFAELCDGDALSGPSPLCGLVLELHILVDRCGAVLDVTEAVPEVRTYEEGQNKEDCDLEAKEEPKNGGGEHTSRWND
mmetsp:Transcript_110642/g.226327  ORF Transcript_110642/g.226327 Transcript_110642/m.226327 type:complete len:342 (-) Transcript_110642:175-1200(-)